MKDTYYPAPWTLTQALLATFAAEDRREGILAFATRAYTVRVDLARARVDGIPSIWHNPQGDCTCPESRLTRAS